MRLPLLGLIALVGASRTVDDIVGDIKSIYIKSRNFNYTYTPHDNGISISMNNEFEMFDVYQSNNTIDQDIELEGTREEDFMKYGQRVFNIPLGDLPELNDQFISIERNRDIDSSILPYVNELEQLQSSASLRVLGDIYAFGHFGIPVNIDLSHSYFKQIIDMNPDIQVTEDLGHAHFMLGVFYGSGVLGHHEQSYGKSLIHYQLADDLGDLKAAMSLGHIYQYGIGVEENPDVAVMYYSKLMFHIETLIEPLMVDIHRDDDVIKDLIWEPNLDKFSFRIADFFDGLYTNEISQVRSSLRKFETFEDYLEVNTLNEEDGLLISQSEVNLNDKSFNYYFKVQSNYKGDYLHARNYEKAGKYAQKCVDTAKAQPQFENLVKGSYAYDKPEWSIYAGRCALYLSHMYYRGEGVTQDSNMAQIYGEMARNLTTSKLFASDLAVMNLYGIGIEKNQTKGASYLNKGKTVSQLYFWLLTKLDQLEDDAEVDGSIWTQLSQVGSFDFHLAERKQILIWLEGKFPKATTTSMAHYLASYIKNFEPIFFNFRETFMANINGDTWKSLMGFLIQSELGYEHAQSSLGTLLYPTLGPFSDKTIRYDPDIYSNVFTKRRYLEALKFFELSAKHGNPDTKNFLGDMYYWGLPSEVPPTFITALRNINILDHILPIQSEEKKSNMTVDKNLLKALAQYHDAVDSGSHMGCYNVGWAYEFGVGVAQDLHLAKRYYDMALQRSQVGFMAIKVALWRIYLKAKLWGLLGYDGRGVGSFHEYNTWSERLINLLNWGNSNTNFKDLN